MSFTTRTSDCMHYSRITIITPSFNQAAFLGSCIDSVLSQNYPNLQYILIDGGSSDGSLEIIKRHAHHLDYWISEKDGGQAEALTRGFARATPRSAGHRQAAEDHHLLAYLNSDDLYAAGALQRVAEAYKEFRARAGAANRDDCWLVGDVENFGEGIAPFSTIYPQEKTERDRFFWFYANPVHQPGAFWSAGLFRRFGPFDSGLRYVFDYDFFMRLRFLANIRPVHIPHTIARFRLHDASKTVSELGKFEPEFDQVRGIIAGQLTVCEQQEMQRYVRQTKADRLQVAALDQIRQGNRAVALSRLAQSLWYDPRLLLQRRTAGAIKRLVLPGA